jgi:lactobin A/cerein 7B family class IIb bacteriocin
MKKQNLNNKLAFNKAAVVELNDNQLQNVNGGSTPTTVSSFYCVAAIVGAVVYLID